MKINSYNLAYTIIAPSGEIYSTKEMVVYTVSWERAIELLDKEIQRRLGNEYRRHITCIHYKYQAQ